MCLKHQAHSMTIYIGQANSIALAYLSTWQNGKTHSIYERTEPTCGAPLGGRLPNINDPNLPEDKKQYFMKFMIVMFKAFRDCLQLLGSATDWKMHVIIGGKVTLQTTQKDTVS